MIAGPHSVPVRDATDGALAPLRTDIAVVKCRVCFFINTNPNPDLMQQCDSFLTYKRVAAGSVALLRKL